jgi:hypothetical protein
VEIEIEFQLPDAAVLRARVYVAAAGCHSLEINGRTSTATVAENRGVIQV